MDVIKEILRPVTKIVADHLKRELRYLVSCTKYVKELGDKIQDLREKRDQVKKHIDKYNIMDSETPQDVKNWLGYVEVAIAQAAEVIPGDNIGCSDIRRRYGVGKKAFDAAKMIGDFINKNPGTSWNRLPIPHGYVDSSTSAPAPSTSSGGEIKSDYNSRDKPFKEALKFLQQDDTTQVIALCGMGGIGKTTMMKRLRKHAVDNQMFNQIVEAVIGRERNMFAVQKDVADHTGGPLKEESVTARIESLRKRFENLLKAGKKVLVILDDVWQKIELENIGLASPLPNGVKLLLTSRFVDVCEQIAVGVRSLIKVVKVNVLEVEEARNFFFHITEISEADDRGRYEIGCGIVKRCGYLPLAIKLVAATVKGKEKSVWENKLNFLMNNDLSDDLKGIIEDSYKALGKEERDILQLCGLHPEDSNIPIEDLARYAWGLRLFKGVPSFGYARGKTETCVNNLKSANLLMDADYRRCVKMHDLVLAFVVDTVSKGEEDAWIIDHGAESNWSEVERSESCKRISLSCGDRSEFPSDFKFPNLSFLMLGYGGFSLKFPMDFYEEMKNLKVIGYIRMKFPLLPTSFQYSPYLRTLCLHECWFAFDYSCIGDLSNLEVLSFAQSNIEKLPSTFRNLTKLRLLDLTDCYNLVIDDGVLGNLCRLEELYMSSSYNDSGVSLTRRNYEELATISKNLFALEIKFFNDAPPQNMQFDKLKRFKISVGRPSLDDVKNLLGESDKGSYENTLMLVTSKDRLLESRMNDFFKETVYLHLEIDSMKDLEDLNVHPPTQNSTFHNLRSLVVSKCGNLEYLFTLSVAKTLQNLETLAIAKCPIMEAIMHTEDNGAEAITFPKLRSLRLDDLSKLSCLCYNVNVIKLPHLVELVLSGLPKITRIYHKNEESATSSSNISTIQNLFNEQVDIHKLEELDILNMENLEEIWPCEYISNEDSKLRSIEVKRCKRLVNLFPSNPMPLLRHLEYLEVEGCALIEILFDINMDTVSKIEDGSSVLRRIKVVDCDGLVSLFPSNPMTLLRHLEELVIEDCASIETLFNIDLDRISKIEECSSSKLRRIEVFYLQKLREIWKVKCFNDGSTSTVIGAFEAVERIGIKHCQSFENVFTPAIANFNMGALKDIEIFDSGECRSTRELEVDVAFGSSFMHNYLQLHKIRLDNYGVEVVFQIESGSSKKLTKTQSQILLPNLTEIELRDMGKMSHVWECNWNDFLILQKLPEMPFRSLTTIKMKKCKKIKYLLSPFMVKLLSNLKEIEIGDCCCLEEVVSNRDDINEEEIMPISPSSSTQTITTFFPLLDSLSLSMLSSLKRIGGGSGSGNGGGGGRKQVSSINATTPTSIKASQVDVIPWSLCQYSRKIRISRCRYLSSVIPSYALGQMQKLELLEIEECDSMIEVFESEGINNNVAAGGSRSNSVAEGTTGTDPTSESPRLKKINVPQLLHLKEVRIHYCGLLQHVFTFSALESLKKLESLSIRSCKEMKVIVKEENGDQTEKDVVFPRLKSILLASLPNLEGFFLGMNDFQWKSLELVEIYKCPRIRLFTTGRSTAPKLKFIHGNFGKYVTANLDQTHFPSLSLPPATSQGKPWPFHNTIELNVVGQHDIKHVIPSNELPRLQKLQKIQVRGCCSVEEVFETALEGTNSGFNDTFTSVEIPNLREVRLHGSHELKYIWKSNQWVVLQFPNLTRLDIDHCRELKHVFTCSMAGSLSQLQELHLNNCNGLEVIVKEEEEECNRKVNEPITLPCLKSLRLDRLYHLKGFCLGKQAFSLPALDTLNIYGCPALTVFTKGHVTTPKLNAIDMQFQWGCVREDLNSYINTINQE